MSETLNYGALRPSRAAPPAGRETRNGLAAYGASAALAGGAALIGFVVEHLSSAPNVTLVFVLSVVVAATSLGFRPAILTTLLSVLAFDFFFTEPLYSLRIHSEADVWAAALLLVIAAIVSTVAADARRRAQAAQREAARATALHDLAHLVVQSAPAQDVATATAQALASIFQAPAVVLVEQADTLEPAAFSNGGAMAPSDLDAARWSLANQTPSHADNYPFEASTYDFWPIRRQGSPDIVLGVRAANKDDWPEAPAKYVELVGAYLSVSLTAPRRP